MKKVIALLLALCMTALCLTACTGAADTSSVVESTVESTADSTVESTVDSAPADSTAAITTVTPGKLTVATSPDFAPYEFYAADENGDMQLAGFDMALAQQVADDLGLELVVKPMDFDSIMIELQSGTVDMALAGFSPTPERAEAVDFSDLYYTGGQSLVVLADNAETYATYESLAGKVVEAQNASIQMDLANQYTPDAIITGIPAVTTIIMDLLQGKCDAAFIETAVAECYMKQYPEMVIVQDVEYDVQGSAIAIQKGNTALVDAANSTIAKVLADGTMDQFVADANALASGEIYEGLLDSESAAG